VRGLGIARSGAKTKITIWRRVLAAAVAVGVVATVLSAESQASGAFPTAGGPEARPRPNIVMVMTDDQNVRSMSVLPNVRELLARQGTTFVNSFASFPLCCPSRATYLTGQYPHNHDVVGNRPPDGGYERLRQNETLPVWLGRSGYATAHIGKYLNGYGTANPTEIPPGWQEWYGSVDPTTYRMWGYTLNENGRLRTYGRPDNEDPRLYQTDVYAAKAADYIRRRAPADRPFFLSLAPLAPHSEGAANTGGQGNPRPAPRHKGAFADRPLPRPPSFNEANLSDKPAHIRALKSLDPTQIARMTRNYRARLESLLAVDEAVARVVRELAARDELDNTLIIFTADNGWLQGEHRIPNGKIHPYEESIRVALVVRGPGMARNVRSATPVSNIDLASTIVETAGARPAITTDGRSLRGLDQPDAARDLLIETGPKRSGDRWYAAIRTRDYVYIEHSTGEQELYDLRIDPFQRRSLHADPAYAERKRDLTRRLHALRRCAGDTCP
jgi:N-acetylglucosamine-6-sulfatase